MKHRVTTGINRAFNLLGVEKLAEVWGISTNGVYMRMRGQLKISTDESIRAHEACKGKVSKLAFMTYEN